MDDPIFDPWAIRDPDSVADDVPPVSTEAPVARRWVVPSSPIMPADAAALARPPELGREGERGVPPSARHPEPSPIVPRRPRPQPLQLRALQGVARPRLEEVQKRLHVSGHQAVLADLTDREAPSLRFRFVPRRGAFDEPRSVEGSVLEFAWDDEAGHVAARFWLDPLAKECSDEVTAPPARVDPAWIDRVVLEFVGKALRASA